jgi:hypothetical protein
MNTHGYLVQRLMIALEGCMTITSRGPTDLPAAAWSSCLDFACEP